MLYVEIFNTHYIPYQIKNTRGNMKNVLCRELIVEKPFEIDLCQIRIFNVFNAIRGRTKGFH